MIKIDEFYRIETDDNNFILKYEKPNGVISVKSGKEEVSKDEWYFPTIKSSLVKYMNESLKPCDSLENVLIELKRVEELILKLNK